MSTLYLQKNWGLKEKKKKKNSPIYHTWHLNWRLFPLYVNLLIKKKKLYEWLLILKTMKWLKKWVGKQA